jgi:hypothetical protein
MRRLATALGSLAFATLLSAPALADCVPGTGLCAGVGARIGIPVPGVQVGGQVTVGIPIPTIIFPGATPPPAAPPPPEAPPQVVVVPQYQPQPAYQYYPQRPMYGYAPQPNWGASRLGVDLRVDGAAGFGGSVGHNAYGMGGAGVGLRYRATPHFGVELGVDVLGGRDYNDNHRLEVAGSLGGLLFVNPRSRVQLYFSAGVLADHARANGDGTPTTTANSTVSTQPAALEYNHVGGYGGLGLEMFATRHLSFHLDARGLIRQNVGGNSPEFTDANGKSTNTSGGVLGTAGMVFYF